MKSELASISPLQAPQFAWRGLATILLIGGLLLVILGQSAYTAVPKPLSYMVTSLALIGVVAFLLGGRIAVKQQIPDWLQRPTSWLAGYFAVMPGQILLFFFAICFS